MPTRASIRDKESLDDVSPAAASVTMVISCFTIANDMALEVQAAFRSRPHLVDHAHGFLGMEVMSPLNNSAEIWLLTRWRDEQSYQTWHRGHEYRESHMGLPKGLKLVPGKTQIRVFSVFAN